MSEAWVEAKFRVCYLTEQHRQGNDYLNDILNAIRAQQINDNHIQAFTNNGAVKILVKPLRALYTHNMDVNSINFKQVLIKLTKNQNSLMRSAMGMIS